VHGGIRGIKVCLRPSRTINTSEKVKLCHLVQTGIEFMTVPKLDPPSRVQLPKLFSTTLRSVLDKSETCTASGLMNPSFCVGKGRRRPLPEWRYADKLYL